MRRYWIRLAGLGALLLGLSNLSALAETHALLIGVSSYPKLPPQFRLQGPRNDVQSMQRALSALGVPSRNISVLADGLTHPATRQSIFQLFDSARAKMRPGDWLILYLSGHGSQQPQLGKGNGYQESDGLDEIFLPYDIGKWDGRVGKVENAILDDEFGEFIGALNAQGVSVWAIFDTCHAGNMAKGLSAPDVDAKYRYISPSTLEIPRQLMMRSNAQNVSPKKSSKSTNQTALQVNFYASAPDEQTPEELLASLTSANGRPTMHQGLFTWHLAKLLPSWQGSFVELAQQISAAYRAEQRPFPSPTFEGDLGVTPSFLFNPDKPALSASTFQTNRQR